MTAAGLRFAVDRAGAGAIAEHLRRCDTDFDPPLSTRVDLAEYARKIAVRAVRFEAWSGEALVGLVAAYCNDPVGGSAFITDVSVERGWQGQGIAARLLAACIEHARAAGFRSLGLEVASGNEAALRLYRTAGFLPTGTQEQTTTMRLTIQGDPP